MSAKVYAIKKLKEFMSHISGEMMVDEEDLINAILKAVREDIQLQKGNILCEQIEGNKVLIIEELIQGYTAKQWQEIIDGGYLCEFSGSGNSNIGKLENIKKETMFSFQQVNGSNWTNCRPAQIKGVMRPIFVEPTDTYAPCVFFGNGGTPMHRNTRWGYKHGLSNNPKPISYIEL